VVYLAIKRPPQTHAGGLFYIKEYASSLVLYAFAIACWKIAALRHNRSEITTHVPGGNSNFRYKLAENAGSFVKKTMIS
jgi:hypothetical protein